ncbi:MAG: hypothetical protein A3K19_17220 [Lentisphaerae bacterium RIFOXYB12_FULL_65_16]|nr:MAG: hypothetical protein A3K18_08805 [Lentisphaerae bacterium RIFOXYA12_64_32]OGV93006.1 MAG: hypothetical protein A3K19_17220 [Lentisphaerae bacterium RIFOXYB12_FULL_65_16]
MNNVLRSVLAALTLTITAVQAQLVDDFSSGGWVQFADTPGTMSIERGKLLLKDGAGDPGWVTVSKTFTVDIDKTPVFIVKVVAVSDRGTVKLIRQDPYDKQVAIEIDRPGLYAVDMRSRFGWKGVGAVETNLYAIGDDEEITYEYVRYAERLTPEEEELIKNRASGGNVKLDVAPFEVVPLFTGCSFYFKSQSRPGGLPVRYRKTGGEWLKAFPPVYMEEDGMYRGSIVDLEEDTLYELTVSGENGEVLAEQSFQTWRTEVPVAKTIVLDEATFTGRLVVKECGTPDGWIKITAKEGFVLRNDRIGPLIELHKAKYIILDGLTLRGGLKEAITIRKCEQVRVLNCDIAGWGRIGTQRFDLDGKYFTESGGAINWDTAILVSKSIGTVVERCYIHDPVSTANSWYYSHPAGPQAVGMDKPRSTVVRYNDFIGSDRHRWNDAIEGAGNFDVDGGFNRDADIYGNLMCFANDDALEIDGGQTNVRVFLNKFEGCLCGVSIQGCMSSPSYVFRNLLVNMGDERGLAGQTIKTSSYANGPSAVSFIFGNTSYGKSSDLQLVNNLRIVAKNNIFAGPNAIRGRKGSPQSECDYNLSLTGEAGEEVHGVLGQPGFVDAGAGLFALRETSDAIGRGVAIDNFAVGENGRVDMGAIPLGSDAVLPARPIPVCLDRYQLTFSASDTKAAPAKTFTATVRGEAFSSRFRIAKNEAFDWFRVAPENGVLESGKALEFTVTLLPEKMTERAVYKGAILVRLENGYSRPVMVYADTEFVPATKPSRDGVWATYIEAEAPTGGKAYDVIADPTASGANYVLLSGPAKAEPSEYRFSVPQAGKYFVLLRVKSEEPVGSHNSVFFGVDDGAFDQAQLRSATSWGWSMAAHNRAMSLICLQAFDLAAGEHVLKLAPRKAICVDLVAITDNPGMFE